MGTAYTLYSTQDSGNCYKVRLSLHRKGYAALGVMEERLSAHDWLAGNAYSVADIALYAYTHVAHQGCFDLGPYPGVRAWLDRFAAEPRHVDLCWKPESLA